MQKIVFLDRDSLMASVRPPAGDRFAQMVLSKPSERGPAAVTNYVGPKPSQRAGAANRSSAR